LTVFCVPCGFLFSSYGRLLPVLIDGVGVVFFGTLDSQAVFRKLLSLPGESTPCQIPGTLRGHGVGPLPRFGEFFFLTWVPDPSLVPTFFPPRLFVLAPPHKGGKNLPGFKPRKRGGFIPTFHFLLSPPPEKTCLMFCRPLASPFFFHVRSLISPNWGYPLSVFSR